MINPLEANNPKLKAHQSAFTLIELLIVITILGVLMTLGYNTFQGSQQKARDAERKSDLKQIQKALELYQQDKPTPQYPQTSPGLSALVSPIPYMNEEPGDPLPATWNWPDYSYTRDSQLEYTLYACLENENDPQADAVDACTVKGVSYTITEP